MLLRLLLLLALTGVALSQEARIVVDVGRPTGEVSPLLYGQFAEFMFENIKGGMHAELLRDRSFEEAPNAIGLPRHWERDPDDRNDDPDLNFTWDAGAPYPPGAEGEHALKLEVGNSLQSRHGIRQGGIPVRAGVPYEVSLWARAQSPMKLAVALEADQTGGRRYAASETEIAPGDWRQLRFQLTPGQSDPLAKLAVLVDGKGTLWLDQLSLMPGDAVDGVRADVLAATRELRPAFIRWPGGNVAQDYFWTWGVGPRDQRKTWINLSWKNEPEPSDFGTDEYVAFCRNLGAEPMLTVNVEGRGATPELAAQWVEYCNGPVTSKFGAMRAANGHPEPYGIKVWEIGNEIWGPWVRGHSDAATYGRNFQRYVQAMRAVDPTLKFIAVGDNDMAWNRTVLSAAGKDADYLAIHHYYGFNETERHPDNMRAHPLHYERFYRSLRPLLPPGTKLAINEWNTSLPVARQHSMESGCYAGRMLNVFLRSQGLVAMSCVSDLVNGWSGGVIQASRHGLFRTPTYWVNALYATRRGDETVEVSCASPTFDTSAEGSDVPTVDVAAARRENELFLYVVNTDPSREQRLVLDVRGARVAPRARLETVAGEGSNSFERPDAVGLSTRQVQLEELVVPPQSVSVVTLTLQPR